MLDLMTPCSPSHVLPRYPDEVDELPHGYKDRLPPAPFISEHSIAVSRLQRTTISAFLSLSWHEVTADGKPLHQCIGQGGILQEPCIPVLYDFIGIYPPQDVPPGTTKSSQDRSKRWQRPKCPYNCAAACTAVSTSSRSHSKRLHEPCRLL